MSYFEEHFRGKHHGESIVEVVENNIALVGFVHRVLGGQRNRTPTYNKHYERVKVFEVHYVVHRAANSDIWEFLLLIFTQRNSSSNFIYMLLVPNMNMDV